MKKRKKKLSLNKETISKLHQGNIRGGVKTTGKTIKGTVSIKTLLETNRESCVIYWEYEEGPYKISVCLFL